MREAATLLLLLAAAVLARTSTAQAARHRIGFGRLPPLSRPRAGRLWRRQLPPTGPPEISAGLLASCADLLAACLEAGAVPAAALSATGACLPDPLGKLVAEAGEALADGVPVDEALPVQGPLTAISAVFRRSARSGSAMTDQLVAVAEQLRADDQFDRLERAQRVGVLSALPLGLCMLPAFLLLAVVPAVAGLGPGLLLTT